ncbi:heparanase-like protein 1 [Amaranthus tricolor]|uniref:heparanase-like protein 1 n=1 Tax=Amaranthus tricolor TaxID=29722 RepID=UPI00258EB69C|nr:heparanase-like protein 1 [Amaranthus tricolor]XP_057519907.1 heparanase-like protein 1 [Amaranthus tricolor]
MGVHKLVLCLLLLCFPSILAQEITRAILGVHGGHIVAETDENYVCATIDWWPHNKCDYNQCPWGYSSIMNLNLSHSLLAKAVQAFTHLRLRLGGSLEDQVLYGVPSLKHSCHPFWKGNYGLFGFSTGCLRLGRWDALNNFFSKTGAVITFGINALYGRQKSKDGAWIGPWDSSNAYDFIKYTVSKGYKIDSWEFGNELSGSGVGARVDAARYGNDLKKLKGIIDELYKSSPSKPSLLAPGGFFSEDWFTRLLQVTGPGVLNALTHHIYNLGAGNDPNLPSKILDPTFLSKISKTFDVLNKTIHEYGPWTHAWVGEAGGAFNSGGHLVSDAFIDGFWYLDQLGLAATYNTKVYCRQTLIGGNYGLLDKTTFVPNPDYYGALLWNRLMGRKVLQVDNVASPYLRSYAHCTKGRAGITLLLINLSKQTRFIVKLQNTMNKDVHISNGINSEGSFMRGLKKTVSWVGSKASDGQLHREEYHLTPKEGNLQSQTMVLNGIPLQITEDGNIPNMEPVLVPVNSPLYISPLSISFIVFPNFDAPVCKL